MMNKEEYIKGKMGKTNPFRVPEGYFDDFASQLMDNLPQRELRAIPVRRNLMMRTLRPVLYAAACLCIAIFSVTVYFTKISGDNEVKTGNNVAAVHTNNVAAETYDEAVADYVMIDNADIYAYLSSEK